MSRKKLLVLVLMVLLAIGIVFTGACAPTRTIEDVTPEAAHVLMQENRDNPDFVILDVRTPPEFTDGHIENAISIDYYSQTFRDELDRLDKSQTYLIYCQSGNRSGKARDIMAELGFQEVYNVSGGIIAWKAAGLPTEK